MHHPWRALRAMEDWTYVTADLPPGCRGQTSVHSKTIQINSRLLQVERRCTITQEVIHAGRGWVPHALVAAGEERIVRALTARRLIALDDLIDALQWSREPAEVADELWVTVDVLETRVAHLHPAEWASLRSRLGE